jgi:hypothetical protein
MRIYHNPHDGRKNHLNIVKQPGIEGFAQVCASHRSRNGSTRTTPLQKNLSLFTKID